MEKKYFILCAPIDAKKENNFKENQHFAELRDWLLPMLMNGQVKVRVADGEEMEKSLSMAAEPQAAYISLK